MEFKSFSGSLENTNADITAIFYFEEDKNTFLNELDSKIGGVISFAKEQGNVKGKKNKVYDFVANFESGLKRLALVGLGKKDKFNAQAIRNAAGTVIRKYQTEDISSIAFYLDGEEVLANAQAVVEGSVIAEYQSDFLKSDEEKKRKSNIKECTVGAVTEISSSALANGKTVGDSVNLARTLGNNPGNIMTPKGIVETAMEMCKEVGMETELLDEAKILELGMNSLYSVGHGSDEPSFLLSMFHKAKSANKPTIALIGKGISFDAGGISLKPGAGMEEMKFDMCGSAAVVGAMKIIGTLKPDFNVIGMIACAENMPSARATKPGDIITAMDGTTIEIINTDAEGRLVLCDAINYAQAHHKVDYIIDLATLTGMCVATFAKIRSAYLTNDDDFGNLVSETADSTGELVWELPTDDEYADLLKSSYCDLKNIGGRLGGTITAGLFLRHFVKEPTKWVHLDIAGTAWDTSGKSYLDSGATGVMVRTLPAIIEKMQNQ